MKCDFVDTSMNKGYVNELQTLDLFYIAICSVFVHMIKMHIIRQQSKSLTSFMIDSWEIITTPTGS